MEFEYKVKSEGFSGTVTIVVLKYTERLRLLKELNFKPNSNGEMEAGVDAFENMAKMLEKTGDFVKSVSVVREDGLKYSSYEDLLLTADEVCNELSQVVINGLKFKKNN